ncbi:MAG: TadE/TadG family type IV pilus assembly protein [Acidobacteria bacterium]|nr:TadE/TadG family type IV pilus assembly protein [Acidobacteriota bacterium]
MVEFSLFFITFLVLSVGLMELGRGVWTYVTLSHAARAGGRYAIVHGASNPIAVDGTTVTEYVKDNAVGLNDSNLSVVVSYDTGTPGDAAPNVQGNVVEIRVQYPFQLVSGGLIASQSTIQMASTTRMVVLN